MFYDNKIWIGVSGEEKVSILPQMANRHGLIAGATGTGKTVTLKVLAESFSDAGVPVFLADIKGDLAGMCQCGIDNEDMQERIKRFGLDECGFTYQKYPTVFWDIFQETGVPLRTTVSEMGPILMSKLMNLNDTQSDILTCLYKMADDEDLLLVDLKDLKAILQYASENAKELSLEYGNITPQSIAAIIRNVVALEAAGGDKFFSDPALNIADFFTNDISGKGCINVLDGRKLATDKTLYSAFLLWLLSELFEALPEVGDRDKPRMVFFFDEAHLLFNDISKVLCEKIEQIVKLIRSKGVGVYFISQSPRDIPDGVLAQLGNKVQHALHAYTPSEEKALKTVADSFRANPEFDTKEELSQLGVGEALVSVLDEEGIPTIVKKCKILPPCSKMGSIDEDMRKQEYVSTNLYLKYRTSNDPDSAYEFLERRKSKLAEEEAAREKEELAQKEKEREDKEALKQAQKEEREEAKRLEREEKAKLKEAQKQEQLAQKEADKKKAKVKKVAGSVASTTAGTIGRELGQQIGSSMGGSFGKKLGGNVLSSIGRSIMGNLFK